MINRKSEQTLSIKVFRKCLRYRKEQECETEKSEDRIFVFGPVGGRGCRIFIISVYKGISAVFFCDKVWFWEYEFFRLAKLYLNYKNRRIRHCY